MGKGNAFVSRRKEKEEEEVTISYDDVEDLIGKESSLRAASSSLAPTVDSVASSSSEPSTSSSTSALFSPVSAEELRSLVRPEYRKIPVPPHRFTPMKKNWMLMYQPLVEKLKLQVRMNLKSRSIEIRTCRETEDPGAIQKAADFIQALCLGFEVDDAVALLRMDDLFIDSFEIKDVKTLKGDNLSRAIGRIAGKDGKTKFTIENATRTRIVLADSKIHLLGSFQNIKVARDAIVDLIIGSPANKVYSKLRGIVSRMREKGT